MSNTRMNYSPEFKFKIGLVALSETKTIGEIAGEYEVHPTQVSSWKKQLKEHGKIIFEGMKTEGKTSQTQQKEVDKLYRQIGQLSVENDWLKKKSGLLSI